MDVRICKRMKLYKCTRYLGAVSRVSVEYSVMWYQLNSITGEDSTSISNEL